MKLVKNNSKKNGRCPQKESPQEIEEKAKNRRRTGVALIIGVTAVSLIFVVSLLFGFPFSPLLAGIVGAGAGGFAYLKL